MIVGIFDTETTGLISNHTVKMTHQPHVIEFYGCYVNLKNSKVLRELEFLIRPPVHIEQEITNITTITDDLVKDAPSFKIVADEIIAFIEAAPLLIAHNASYDKEILDLEAERLSKTIKWPRMICSVEQTVAMKGIRLSLSDLHKLIFGAPHSGAHRARADVEALTRCCVELYKVDIL